MNLREDAICPACPDPETAFRIEDVGMKFETEGDMRCDDWVALKVTRPAWEAVMLAHIETQDDDQHQRLYAECMTALAGRTVEQAAQEDAQSAVDNVTRSLHYAAQPHDPETLDLRPKLFAGIPKQIDALSPWTERINAFNRRVLEEPS